MHRTLMILMTASVAAFVGTGIGGYFLDGYLQQIVLALFGTFVGVFIGLVVVNIVLDKSARQIAAGPLIALVQNPITSYHNDLFIRPGRDRFGIDAFNRMIEKYKTNHGNPQAFTPQERLAISQLIDDKSEECRQCLDEIDAVLTTAISVLGWSYDAKIIAAALTCKNYIAEFRLVATPADDNDRLKRIERYFDIDGSSGAFLRMLNQIYGTEVTSPETS